MALNAAALDTRIKATVASTMYDNFDAGNSEDARYEKRQAPNAQRTAYYKTPRGCHPRSLNSNGGWDKTGCMSFLNQPILCYADEIRSAVLVIHGEKTHSCYFSRDVFAKLTRNNKELLIIPGAVHTDLYDNLDEIPFYRMADFFRAHLG